MLRLEGADPGNAFPIRGTNKGQGLLAQGQLHPPAARGLHNVVVLLGRHGFGNN